jgi:predicted phosphoadenosine phosphosulfate sulfurtransferase
MRMTETLSKITKPSADKFKKGRKLYYVPLPINIKEASSKYQEKYGLY